jgi:hypothetical protein
MKRSKESQKQTLTTTMSNTIPEMRPADNLEEEDALPFKEEEQEPKIKTKIKQQLFKSKQRHQDHDHLDNYLFNKDSPALTTPTSANRIVSAATALRQNALADEDDKEMAKHKEEHKEIEDQ